MAEKEGYNIENYNFENIYQGGYNSLDPSKGGIYPKNQISVGDLSVSTDPRTAHIVKDASHKLSSGVKNVEISAVSPETLDSIPNEQLKEANRLFKLVGVNPSFHAPVVEPTGITKEGWSESEREKVERQMTEALKRSQTINPDKNVQVTFHSSAMLPGSEFKPGEISKGNEGAKKLLLVDRESGKMVPAEEETKYYPHEKNIEKHRKAKKIMEDINNTKWDDDTSKILMNKENADKILENLGPITDKLITKAITKQHFNEKEEELYERVHVAHEFVKHSKMEADALFNKAYKYAKEDGDERKLKELKNIAAEYRKRAGFPDKDLKQLNKEEYFKLAQAQENPRVQSKALNFLVDKLRQDKRNGGVNLNPNLLIPVEEFAVKQASKTFGNAAFKTYKDSLKNKSKVPIIGIENPPAGGALATGEDLKNLVKTSRNQFVKKATLSQKEGGLGMSKSQAEKQAEKMIGVTWDVGHINMLRKQGFSEKDIIKETETIAPYTKHVHLSDNFGFEHTELPMGMGNVPMQEIMKKLGKKGFEGKKVIEAASWWQHFSNNGAISPLQPSLEAMGSPIYSMKAGPSWENSYQLQGGYFGGYGEFLPQGNFNTFGAGFSQLPTELGGQRAGGQGSRMSGRPME